MPSKRGQRGDAAERGKRAEESPLEKASESPEDLDALSPEQMRQLLRDLRARQVQLEAQNEALRAAQNRGGAASILESISDAFFSMNDDMVVTYFNHAAEIALRRSSDEVLGRGLFDAFPEARGSVFEEQYTRALKEKIQVSFETYFGVSPYENWYEVRVYPSSEGISVFFQVITERKQAKETLEAAHAELEALWGISSLADATVRVVSDHILASITRMTQSEYGFYGFVNEDESVMTIHAWSGEAMRDCSMVDKPSQFPVCSAGVWGEAIRRRKPLILNEYAAAHQGKKGLPEGHVALSKLMVVPFFSHGRITAVAAVANRTADYGQDDVDQITAFLVSVQAIADSKRAEEALRESEERFRYVLENVRDAVWSADLSGHFDFLSPVMAEIYGRPLSEMIANPAFWIETVHPEDQAIARSSHDALFRDSSVEQEYRIILPNGTVRWISDRKTLLRDGQREGARMAGIISDITGRKRAEEELERIRWMLSAGQSAAAADGMDPAADQGYGDLAALNCDGVILRSVGKDVLAEIANEYMSLMATSSAVYEKNGDYAYGIFSSGWCRLMDCSSRSLCATDDNAAALNSGKWLCHESCWTQCSKECIAKGAPVDIACKGGIRLHAVPIFAGGQVVGSINFGYGDPPKDPAQLRELAGLYQIEYGELLRAANAYNSRPAYIVELAKKRLFASARLIGALVERKLAEQALQESGKRYQALFEQAGDGIFLLDTAGKIISVNEAFANMHGFTEEEILRLGLEGLDVQGMAPAADRMRRVMAGETITFDVEHYHKDGHTFPLSVAVNLISSGNERLIIAVHRDLTERKQAEEELRFKNLLLSTQQEASIDGILVVDGDAKILSYNQRFVEMWGLPAKLVEDRIDEPVLQFVTAQMADPGSFLQIVQYLYENRRETSQDELILADGRVFDRYSAPMFGPDERYYGRVWYFRDISERKRAEKELRFQAMVLDQIQDHVTVTDMEGRITYVNEAECRSFRCSREELIGRSVKSFGDDPARGATQREIIEHTQAYGEWRGEVVNYASDASEVTMDCRTHVVRDMDGRAIAMCGIATDITERKRAEERLVESTRRFVAAFESVPVLMAISTLETGRFVEVNGFFLKILGYSREEVVGRTSGELGVFVDVSQREKILRMVRSNGSAHNVEVTIRTRAGEIRHGLFSADIIDLDGVPHLLTAMNDITERRLAEEELRRSRERLALATHAAQIGVWDWDIVRNELVWGESMYRLYGIQKEDFAGAYDAWLRCVHPEDRERVNADIEAALRGEREYGPEFRIVWPDGSVHFIQAASQTFTNDLGKAVRMIGTNVDITERKRADAALSTLSLRQEAILTSVPDIIAEVDVNKVYTWMNPTGLEFFGNDAIGKEAAFYFEGEQNVYTAVQPLFNGDTQVVYLESWQRRRDGKRRLLAWWCRVLKDPHGQVAGALSTARDVTEQKRAVEALRESEERYRELVENANSIIIRMDSLGNIVFFNEFAQRFFGYSEEDIVGRNVVASIVPETDSSGRDLRAMILDIGVHPERYASNENENMLRDGTRVWISWTNKPLFDSAGRVREILCVGNDATARKRVEEEKAKLEAQLQQAQKMESVGRLAGGVAHDFNNMLQVILVNADLAMDRIPPGSPLSENLDEIRNSAQRSADLTRQLLAFARRQTVAPKVLDLNETVAGMLKMLQRLIGENIDLDWQPGSNLWAVNVDPSQIDQILANLCVNARDAIVDVGKLTLSTGNSAFDEDYCSNHAGFTPGEYVQIAVSDSGCGMDAETLGHIFEPFFTTKGVGEGTGLGLATVYGVVKQNGGFINACSEPGHGTTFTIYLPRHVGKAEQMLTAGAAEPNERGHETILLVEDEPAVLKLTARSLEEHGYTVLSAVTPGDAIRLAGEFSGEIHLLLTDVIMPEMNGRDVARNVQSLYPNIQRLFMSGYTSDTIAPQGVLDKGVHFIQKPFSTQGLLAKIREALDSE